MSLLFIQDTKRKLGHTNRGKLGEACQVWWFFPWLFIYNFISRVWSNQFMPILSRNTNKMTKQESATGSLFSNSAFLVKSYRGWSPSACQWLDDLVAVVLKMWWWKQVQLCTVSLHALWKAFYSNYETDEKVGASLGTCPSFRWKLGVCCVQACVSEIKSKREELSALWTSTSLAAPALLPDLIIDQTCFDFGRGPVAWNDQLIICFWL